MRFRFWLLALAMLMTAANRLSAAEGPDAVLHSAQEAFKDTMYARAEKFCAQFVQQFPASPHLPEAVLLQARARLEQTNYAGTMEVLTANQNAVGARKDEFVFWMAETRLREGNYSEANKLFARVLSEFPTSPRRVEAAVKQAVASARVGDWPKVIDLLGADQGVFQQEAKTNGAGDIVFQGYLLLGEAQLKRTNSAAADAIVEPLEKRALNATNAWAWNYLLCRIRLQSGKTQSALDITTNLLSLASQTGLAPLQAQSAALRGQILEGLGRLDEALIAYTNNLAARIPADWQNQAVPKIAQLAVAQGRSDEAAQLLEQFVAQNPQGAAADVALVQMAELRLRQVVEWLGTKDLSATNATLATNRLDQAIGALETTTRQFGQSRLLGNAFMDLGWCLWFKDRVSESGGAFSRAAEHLPPGPERATARFKLADTQFRAKEYAAAKTNYETALKEFPAGASGEKSLIEPALYQIVRAGLAIGDLTGASNAVSRIVAEYPKGFNTDRAVLLFGERIGSDGSPGKARELFEEFLKKAPEAALKPELQLAIARTYEQENAWPKAIEIYGGWLQIFTNHPARPDTMYYRGQAMFHAGDETNSYDAFTNFVATYPKHMLAAQARWCIADHYFNAGAFRAAENDYQIIERTWPRTEIGYEALMMAGHAAYLRQGWSDAIDYFYNKLAADTNCPANLHFRALYAYGDTLMSQVSTNKEQDYQTAVGAFETICQQYSTNQLAALACGEKAYCLLQLARSPAGLTNAAEAFKAVLTNNIFANGKAKSIAKVGLGVVLEKQAAAATGSERSALKSDALEHYIDVLDGLYFKEGDGDEFWTKEAGTAAIRLASEMEEWLKVISICDRMVQKLPQIAPTFEGLRKKAQEKLEHGKIVSDLAPPASAPAIDRK